ncbi:MAG: hemolysin family protein [Acidobacteria bacterium]|nr:hemolysin family protein [Acidobacteriota bacterium]
MGSTVSSGQWLLLAFGCGVFYLIFDAARHFVFQLGPVRLRSWRESSEGGFEGRWFRYDSVEFSLISGAVLQLGLVAAIGCTAASLWPSGGLYATGRAMALWAVIVVVWKFVLAFVPDHLAETILRGILPLGHATYYLLWPVLAPLSKLYSHIAERREEGEDEEEATEQEVQAYIDVGEEEGIFEEGEGRLVQLIVDFGDRLAREVMTPRVDILAFEASQPLEELANLFSESKYSRIPIYEQNIDQILGIIHVKDVFEAFLRGEKKAIRDLVFPALFIPESKKVVELLREFQLEHQQIAIVHDEFGGTAGLITIEDLIEEIVGEIADEHEEDEEVSMVQIDDEVYLVNGLLRVEKLEDLFGIDATGEGYETVGGLIFTRMGRVPRGGEVLRTSGLLFEVERADRKRIYRVKVARDPEWDPNEQEEEHARNGRQERARSSQH